MKLNRTYVVEQLKNDIKEMYEELAKRA